jgi:hypothetical protein
VEAMTNDRESSQTSHHAQEKPSHATTDPIHYSIIENLIAKKSLWWKFRKIWDRAFPHVHEEWQGSYYRDLERSNLSWICAILPILTLMHGVLALVFFRNVLSGKQMSHQVVQWNDLLAHVHGWMSIVALVFTMAGIVAWVRLTNHRRVPRGLPFLVLATYLVYSAVLSSVDQLVTSSANAYVIGCFMGAIALRMRFFPSLVAYSLAHIVFLLGISHFQIKEEIRLSIYINGTALSFLSWILSRLMVAGTTREFINSKTIQEQKQELESTNYKLLELNNALAQQHEETQRLNQDLEQRVDEQVEEIVRHAYDISVLNAQLQMNVLERSEELAKALSRLAQKVQSGPEELEEGSVLGGRVRIQSLLGRGGMGTVYQGNDLVTNQTVAVKVFEILPDAPLDNAYRFFSEAMAVSSISHPGVVRSYHIDVTENGHIFQIMEYVPGQDLQTYMEAHGNIDPFVSARIVSSIADALRAAHEVNVIHRDLKPANIMVTRLKPGIKILDFGISKLEFVTEFLGSNQITQEGNLIGTPAYMSPEQIADPSQVTPQSDVYSMGVILYWMIAGRSPYEVTSSAGYLFAHVSGTPTPIEKAIPNIDTRLKILIHQCLEKSPTRRPTTSEVAAELNSIANDNHISDTTDLFENLPSSQQRMISNQTRTIPRMVCTFDETQQVDPSSRKPTIVDKIVS